MSTKRDEVRSMIERRTRRALLERSATMSDRSIAEVVRVNADQLARAIAYDVADEYAFLELADIMEWKRTRVRR
jgi:hypothetical protein